MKNRQDPKKQVAFSFKYIDGRKVKEAESNVKDTEKMDEALLDRSIL